MLSTRYRTALVTGASAGLGAAFVRRLRAEGVVVWGTARNEVRLAEWAEDEGFHAVVLDLEDEAGAAMAYNRASAEAAGFDLVINNAGYGRFARFTKEDFAAWRTQVEAMLITPMRLAHLAVAEMLTRDRGCLVNVASLATEFPLPLMTGYNVVKAGLSALSESLQIETKGTGVSVIDFRPGDYRTDFNTAMMPPASPPDSIPAAVAGDALAAGCWTVLEKNLRAAPRPEKAASDLAVALRRGHRGVWRSGGWFQATAAPFLMRFAPSSLGRWVQWRYLGVR